MENIVDFKYCPSKDTFNKLLDSVSDSSIVFIEDSKNIWTHGEFYGVTWKKLGKEYNTNGYDFVDMGEAGIWATCNVGANSPGEAGLYFLWANVTGNKDGSYFKGITPPYVTTNYKYSKYTGTDYYSSTGIADNKLFLDLEDDAAHVNMGGDWRMPTSSEFNTLCNICNKKYTPRYGVLGMVFTLKSDPSKELFFPATGSYDLWDGFINEHYYLSNEIKELSSNPYVLLFTYTDYTDTGFDFSRFSACCIRAILSKS